MLIKNLSELVLDTPDAPTILGNFIARSIADDCIPPKFLHSYKGKVSTQRWHFLTCRKFFCISFHAIFLWLNYEAAIMLLYNVFCVCNRWTANTQLWHWLDQIACCRCVTVWWDWTTYGVWEEGPALSSTWSSRWSSYWRSTSHLLILLKPQDVFWNSRCLTFTMNWSV